MLENVDWTFIHANINMDWIKLQLHNISLRHPGTSHSQCNLGETTTSSRQRALVLELFVTRFSRLCPTKDIIYGVDM